jgi:hypothetical protein
VKLLLIQSPALVSACHKTHKHPCLLSNTNKETALLEPEPFPTMFCNCKLLKRSPNFLLRIVSVAVLETYLGDRRFKLL